jgi:uridine kinase
MKSKLILLAGPSSSGKSTLAQALYQQLGADCTRLLTLDHYYRDLRHLSPAERALRDFDDPKAWESERLLKEMQQLTEGHSIHMPQYDFNTHLRIDQTQVIEPAPYMIAEGLFALCYTELNAIAALRIFVDVDDRIALERRLERDTSERGRSPECITRQFNETVRPANKKHIRPSSRHAHVVLNGSQPIQSQLRIIKKHLKDRILFD